MPTNGWVESQPPPYVPPGLEEGAEGESAGALHKSKVDYSQLSFVQKRLRKLSITSLCFGALTQKRWERAGGSLLLTTKVNSVQHVFRAVGAGGGGSLHCPTQYFADHLILSQPGRGAEYARVIITAPPPAFFSDFPTVLHAR